MTTEQNKALIREFTDLINAQDLNTALTLFSPDFVDHTPPAGLPPGIDGVRAFFTMEFAAFPDGYITSLDMIAEGDKVVNRMSGEGTRCLTLSRRCYYCRDIPYGGPKPGSFGSNIRFFEPRAKG